MGISPAGIHAGAVPLRPASSQSHDAEPLGDSPVSGATGCCVQNESWPRAEHAAGLCWCPLYACSTRVGGSARLSARTLVLENIALSRKVGAAVVRAQAGRIRRRTRRIALIGTAGRSIRG